MADAPAVRQALRALALLGRQAAPIPAASIARELALPRSTTYRLLGVLVEQGFVVHLTDERRYGLGVAAFELGFAYTRQEPLQWMGRSTLARLVDQTSYNGHFAILHGGDVLYVVEERAAGRASLVTDVGVRLPAHLAASGLAMLAALTPRQLRALFPPNHRFVQRNDTGPESLSELRTLLRDARQAGYAEENGSVTPGFASVGCAVLDHGGYPAAAVALTFPAHELDPPARAQLAVHVQAAARQLSRAIGARLGPSSDAYPVGSGCSPECCDLVIDRGSH
jgi:DNA-binding IclR family transcriptional regulator